MAVSSTIDRRYGRTTQKKGWRTFLKPGWVFAVLAIIAFSYFAFTLLAPWQLNKDDDIVQRNEQIDAAFRVDPAPAEEVFDVDGAIEPGEEWTRVVLEGRYLPEDEVLLRNRPVDSSPAFHSLLPFQLDSGDVILVNRGFEAPLEGGVPPIADPPAGAQSVVGHARLNEPVPGSRPIEDQGHRQVYGINTDQIGEVTGIELAEDYVQLSEGQAGELNAIPVPKLDRGSHLSYGFQWIAFGIMAPLGLGYFIWAELKERRRVKREEAELAEAPDASADTGDAGGAEDVSLDDDPASHPEEDPGKDTTLARSRKMRDRYGDSQPDHYRKFTRR